MTLYREFILDHKGVWPIFVAFVKANYDALIDAGLPLYIIVTTAEKKRNTLQNARLWWLYKTIAEQAWVNGRQFDKDAWHEFFARKHCPKTEMVLPDGEIITRRKSTAEMNIGEFSEYMQNIEIDATTELGVRFE
ncbi:MAG: recombination protein NinB [Burkholderiales bacterium]|nr:recombination protein NinB [Burkholderiales bacterium]